MSQVNSGTGAPRITGTTVSDGRQPGASRQAGTVHQGGAFQGRAQTAAPPPVTGTAAALGLTQEEIDRQRAQTGVNPGGTGYVSGQVQPSGQAMQALRDATSGPANPGTPFNPLTATGGLLATNVQPNNGARGSAGGTTTTTSALTSGQPGAPGATPAGIPRTSPQFQQGGGDTTTRTGALTGGQPSTGPATGGMTGGNRTGVVTNAPIATTGNATADRLLDPGGLLSGPAFGDTGPAMASQAAGFGLSDDLSRERFDYRPGTAASQDAVSLDRTDANEIRARQNQALDALTGAAAGTVPSAAEIQMRQEAGRNVAATLGQARALGGRSAGGAARAGTLASADILSRNAVEGAALRAAEQDRNRQALQQALGGVRGQDIETATTDARLLQEQRQNNLRAQLERDELAERHRQALLQSQLQALGIGAGAGNAVVQGGAANAGAQNRFQGGILSTFGDAVS